MEEQPDKPGLVQFAKPRHGSKLKRTETTIELSGMVPVKQLCSMRAWECYLLSSDSSSEGLEGPSELEGGREIPARGIQVATAAPKENFWENSGIWLMGDEYGGGNGAGMCQGGAGRCSVQPEPVCMPSCRNEPGKAIGERMDPNSSCPAVPSPGASPNWGFWQRGAKPGAGQRWGEREGRAG